MWRQLQTFTLSAGVHHCSAEAQVGETAPDSVLFGSGNDIPYVPRDDGAPPRIKFVIAASTAATDVRRADETTQGGGSAVQSAVVIGDGETISVGGEDGFDGWSFARYGAIVVAETGSAVVTPFVTGRWDEVV